MISKKEIVCPENLLRLAKSKGPVKSVIVNAVKLTAIESAKQAVDANLINPIFIGDKSIIEKNAKEINWDISKFQLIDEPVENNTASIAAKLAKMANLDGGAGMSSDMIGGAVKKNRKKNDKDH